MGIKAENNPNLINGATDQNVIALTTHPSSQQTTQEAAQANQIIRNFNSGEISKADRVLLKAANGVENIAQGTNNTADFREAVVEQLKDLPEDVRETILKKTDALIKEKLGTTVYVEGVKKTFTRSYIRPAEESNLRLQVANIITNESDVASAHRSIHGEGNIPNFSEFKQAAGILQDINKEKLVNTLRSLRKS